jgi:signal transduction histidine kinase
MFAGLLHDIGNPLMSLHGYATDLSDQLKSTPNTDASAVAGLLAQIEALQSITDLFHAAGKVVTPSKGSFKNTLTGASILLRQHAKRIDVRPVVVVGAAPENVMLRLPFGDALRILNNIGANALDSCAGIAGSGVTVVSAILPEGPSLNELRQHGFHLTRKGDSPSAIGPHAVIEFVDMGCGIAASRIPELFTSGYTSKPGGHGLGLTTTVALLDQYQGFAAVFSQEGKGTTFRVYLPCDTVPAELNRSPQVAS